MSITSIVNVAVVDGAGIRTEGATVVVDGERILEVRKGGPAAGTGTVIDGTGNSLMPGMFSSHFHSCYRMIGQAGLPVGMEGSPGLLTLRGAQSARLALDCGFTSVISAGVPHAVDAALKEAIEEGTMRGPRIMAGSRDVSTTGHSQDTYFRWYWGGQHPGVLVCDGPEAFRKGVRTEIKRGAEIIKVFATAGHSVRGRYGMMELARDELKAAIDAAHERGVKIRTHIANKRAIKMAVELGMDVIDHGDGLDDELIEMMAERGTFLAPSCFHPFCALPHRQQSPHTEFMKEEMLAMLAILPKAHAAGVKILIGDDFGAVTLEHGEYGKELGFYVEHAGVSPADVITWATRNGADLMGMAGELGDIKPRMLADLVIVKGDPIADINLLGDPKNVLWVMKNGQVEKI